MLFSRLLPRLLHCKQLSSNRTIECILLFLRASRQARHIPFNKKNKGEQKWQKNQSMKCPGLEICPVSMRLGRFLRKAYARRETRRFLTRAQTDQIPPNLRSVRRTGCCRLMAAARWGIMQSRDASPVLSSPSVLRAPHTADKTTRDGTYQISKSRQRGAFQKSLSFRSCTIECSIDSVLREST